MTGRPAALSAIGISVRIKGRAILSGVGVTLRPGQLVAVAGPNGAGKSTLLRVLAGLTRPDAGSVHLGDRELSTMTRREIGRAIAYIPQDRTVHWPLKARAVVALGRLPHGAGSERGESDVDREKISSALRLTDTTALADRPIGELSGGERARVLIARALAQDTDVLIADEPAAGLDPAHALALFETFARIARDGRAVVVALHDLSLALRFATEAVLVHEGRLAASGPTRDVMTVDNIARVYGITAEVAELAGVPCVIPVSVRT